MGGAMSELPPDLPILRPPAEAPSLRATDEQRQATVERLRLASVAGAITLDEFSERAELAYAARFADDLAPLTADLPETAADGEPARPRRWRRGRGNRHASGVVRRLTVLSSSTRAGRWVVEQRTRFTAVLGSIELDLTEAVLPVGDAELELDLRAVLASVTLIVPPGTNVLIDDSTMLASCDLRLRSATPVHATRTVRVRASGVLGSIQVVDTPPLGRVVAAAVEDQIVRRLSPPRA
jgi:Domain of unknown function (DUF1707)